jgi:hypothetical protein
VGDVGGGNCDDYSGNYGADCGDKYGVDKVVMMM